ncbi:MAG: MmcQ/YjbR family DNA-binding protein, partial [Gammaproteobacteria bacterium]
YTEAEPQYYFVPQYVGPKGWLGVELERGLSWDTIVERVREAYDKVAPASLRQEFDANPKVKLPVRKLKPEEINPLLATAAQKFLQRIEKLCTALPEVSAHRQFGNPVWKAGKKTFACVHRYEHRLTLQIWVGVDQQNLLTADSRYSVPAYMGHNGWIDLVVEDRINWVEVEQLLLGSYRHFALQRMLKLLDSQP